MHVQVFVHMVIHTHTPLTCVNLALEQDSLSRCSPVRPGEAARWAPREPSMEGSVLPMELEGLRGLLNKGPYQS